VTIQRVRMLIALSGLTIYLARPPGEPRASRLKSYPYNFMLFPTLGGGRGGRRKSVMGSCFLRGCVIVANCGFQLDRGWRVAATAPGEIPYRDYDFPGLIVLRPP